MSGTALAEPKPPRTFLGHPLGLTTLFMTEGWERFSYYGMRALLVLYLVAPQDTGGIGMDTALALSIYGVYIAMVYLLTVPGGWIADRLWGPRRTVLWGVVVIACGHYFMAVPVEWSIWPGLVLIAFGTGLLKPNISAMVGKLYDGDTDEGARRDSGFSIFYMGINMGGFVAPLVCGYLGQEINWHLGFGAAGVGMTIALIVYVITGPKTLGNIGKAVPDPASAELRKKLRNRALIIIAVVAVAAIIDISMGWFEANQIINLLVLITVITPFAYFTKILRMPTLSTVERNRMKAYVWIFIGAVIFWMISDQGGSLLNIFADEKTNRDIGGFKFPASWMQSINPIGIIIFAPIFALIWLKLGKRAPTLPIKFALAIALIGLSFLMMSGLGKMAEGGLVPWELLALVIMVQVVAELLLSPTGLSASTRLAPRGLESQVLALWFLATAVGDAIGGKLAGLDVGLGDSAYYALLGGAAIVMAIIFTTQAKRLHHLMEGVH